MEKLVSRFAFNVVQVVPLRHVVDAQRTGKVTPQQFIAAWGRLQIAVTTEEAMAAFNKYGQTRDGFLPYPVFVEALLVGRNRLVGMASDMRKGAFLAGKSADFQGGAVQVEDT